MPRNAGPSLCLHRAPLPLLDATSSRALERSAATGLAAHTLMRRAGESVARLAMAVAPHAGRIRIVAGPGNNGGDALEAASHLVRAGRGVELTLLADAQSLPPDATAALARARDAGVVPGRGLVGQGPADLIIDGLLGIGAHRPPEGAMAAAMSAINAARSPVLAIDLPSGLDAATGRALGPDTVRADWTLALLTLKPGLVTGDGRDLAGQLWLDDLGVDCTFDDARHRPTAWLSGIDPTRVAPRRHGQNKGSFGDVAVVGGARSMSGAALLAARAAHAAGAGRVYVEWLDRSPALARLDPVRPELMFRDGWTEQAGPALERATVVCGCGGGDAVVGPLRALLTAARRLVLDADALNAIAADDTLEAMLGARAERGQRTVMTPHPLEAARLLGIGVAEVEADRLATVVEAARRFGCTVVLKGSGSLIAAPGEVLRINATGNAALATAGTGDVLAGWLGGRWAQHPEPSTGGDRLAFDCASQAVAEHGAAVEPAPRGAVRAGDLIERLHAAWNDPGS